MTQSVGTIIDSSGYHIDLQIDELAIASLAEGQDARITLDAFPGAALTGQVSQIAAIGDSNQGLITYQVTVALAPTDLQVRPLMTASVDIVTERKEDVLAVSNRALRRDATGKYVEVVKGGVASKAYVETGVSNSDVTEILSGLEVGDQVVVSSTGASLLSGSPFGGG
jgi:multidrug efflux pump subunit AcrA (membrane-fusion protein)